MALIKCPECGKEISDRATACPNCGCPIKHEEDIKVDGNVGEDSTITEPKKRSKKAVYAIIGIGALVLVGGAVMIPKQIENKKNATYTEAVNLLEKGKYDEASELLNEIPDYKDVQTIQGQLKYESYAYSSINSLKKILKNPDSFQPYEIKFYEKLNSDENSEADNKFPICIMHYGAQNGFGGNTTGYALCYYEDEKADYELLGTCNSLSESDYDKKDLDDLVDLAVCILINGYKEKGTEIGSVDLNRLKTVLKNDAYSTVKIIN